MPKNHVRVRREWKFCGCLFSSFIKRKIKHFDVVLVQWRQRNLQKNRYARAEKTIAFLAFS